MTSATAIAVGQEIGPYHIDRVLGAGGMGVVYLGRDRELCRTVAIKVVDRVRYGADAARLLLEEARVTAALHHPSICRIHAVGDAGGERFIVMEYVEGSLLSTRIGRSGALPAELALGFAQQIADGVAHAHQHGVTHGDLKSANVIVTPAGTVKILDFGLAVQRLPGTSADIDTTRPIGSGSGAGTVPYMAPELLRGAAPDTRSDVWAIGVVLFEMLAGARPYQGGTIYELAAAILGEPPLDLPVGLPAGLRGTVRRCLAKAPDDRFASARELAAALDGLA